MPRGGTRKVKVTAEVDGRRLEVDTFDDWISVLDARAILSGDTYPIPSDLVDVQVVLDIGANVGATSVYFAAGFPEAVIHAFEPAPETFAMLARNVGGFHNVEPHPFGLHESTRQADLYRGLVGPGQASIDKRPTVGSQADRVRLESAGEWWGSSQLERIDVLKVDTEGCEVPILRSLGEALRDVKVLYLELHSSEDHDTVDAMLAPTHTQAVGRRLFEVSEAMYVRHDLVDGLRPCITQNALLSSLTQRGSR